MKKLSGVPASPGIAFGKTLTIDTRKLVVERSICENLENEIVRLERALDIARKDLASISDKARESIGAEEAAIFIAQQDILQDPELKNKVLESIVNEKVCCDFAWQKAVNYYVDTLRGLDDEYLSARANDVEDVGQRVLAILTGNQVRSKKIFSPSIILARDLTPSDTFTLDRTKILAFCLKEGGPTSHVAILSKALGIPCVMGLGNVLFDVEDGTFCLVNGTVGEFVIDPDEQTKHQFQELFNNERSSLVQALKTSILPAKTSDGKLLEVVANVGSVDDAQESIRNGTDGIGLLRTEFIFLEKKHAPDLHEQVGIYKSIFDTIGTERPIVVRTLDIGGDKPADYIKIPEENNPFLGLRGIRLTLRNQELFEEQLKALLIAGGGYDLRIMFPMVAQLSELDHARTLVSDCMDKLKSERITYCAHPQIGIMVEVPSAAILANVLAKHVDFFSIGTNDLSQYTMAADRTSAEVASLADPYHPAVLELIHIVTEAAHNNGKWVGLCGELAGDSLAVPLLLGLGIDEFSVTPRRIPVIKQIIRTMKLTECQVIASKARRLTSGKEVRKLLNEFSQ